MRVSNFKQAYSWFNIAEDRIPEVNKMQKLLESKTIMRLVLYSSVFNRW